jgi:hypothetical protein
MTISRSDEDIWKWYQIIEDYKKEPPYVTGAQFCYQNNIDYKEFSNMKYRILFRSINDPIGYKVMMQMGDKYLQSGLSIRKFAEDNGLERSILTAVMTHKGYLEAIDRLIKEKAEKPLEFVQIPNKVNIFSPKPELKEESDPVIEQKMVSYTHNSPVRTEPAEVIEPRNDIELNITKGVKVIVSPNIDSMKIIKIIELLKDL